MDLELLKNTIWSRGKAVHNVCGRINSEIGVMGGDCDDQGLFIHAIEVSLCFIVLIYSLYS